MRIATQIVAYTKTAVQLCVLCVSVLNLYLDF